MFLKRMIVDRKALSLALAEIWHQKKEKRKRKKKLQGCIEKERNQKLLVLEIVYPDRVIAIGPYCSKSVAEPAPKKHSLQTQIKSGIKNCFL